MVSGKGFYSFRWSREVVDGDTDSPGFEITIEIFPIVYFDEYNLGWATDSASRVLEAAHTVFSEDTAIEYVVSLIASINLTEAGLRSILRRERQLTTYIDTEEGNKSFSHFIDTGLTMKAVRRAIADGIKD